MATVERTRTTGTRLYRGIVLVDRCHLQVTSTHSRLGSHGVAGIGGRDFVECQNDCMVGAR